MNFPLNKCDFTLYRGLSNPITVLIKDIDRKPATLASGIVPIVTIIQKFSRAIIFSGPMTLTDPTQSIWTFQVGPSDIDDWTIGQCTYTVTMQDASGNLTPLFMDRDYGIQGEVSVLDGPLPQGIGSTVILASDMLVKTLSNYSGAFPGAAQRNNLSGLQTIAAYGTNFSGTIEVQGLLDTGILESDDQWLSIETFTIAGLTGINRYDFEGNFYWVRLIVTPTPGTTGTIDQILLRT